MGIFGSKAGKGLPVANFDTDKRYDVYLHVGDVFTCIRGVKCQGIRVWESFDPEDNNSIPVDSYLEAVDATGNTVAISTSSIVLFTDSGATLDLSKFHI